jgi:hypothetical protein
MPIGPAGPGAPAETAEGDHMVGAALAGALIVTIGTTPCFAVNAVHTWP